MTAIAPEKVLCAAKCAKCVCVKPAGHVTAGDEVHACDPEKCGGSWTGEYGTGDWQVVSFPGNNLALREYESRLLEEFDTLLYHLEGREE